MFGSEEMNELRVIIQDNSGESVVWHRKGNQSSLWKYGAITHAFPTQRKIKVIDLQKAFLCTVSAFVLTLQAAKYCACKLENITQDLLGLYFVNRMAS